MRSLASATEEGVLVPSKDISSAACWNLESEREFAPMLAGRVNAEVRWIQTGPLLSPWAGILRTCTCNTVFRLHAR